MVSQMQPAQRRIITFSWWGQTVAFLAMMAMIAGLAAFFYGVAFGLDRVVEQLIRDFGVQDITETLKPSQRWVASFLWFIPDLFGFAMMFGAWRLFQGFRTFGVFTHDSADRLRSIGWCIFAIAPANIITTSIGASYLAFTNTPSSGRLHLSLEDTDVYALLIGLIIIAVGHIMVQAVEISNENKSFV